MRQVTLHWLRHWFATHALAQQIPDKTIMEQQGWRDVRSLHRYQHDVQSVRRLLIEAMPIGGGKVKKPT
jgi:integrase